MQAFEHWFSPYPFYEDSFKLVETPYLGMEHQVQSLMEISTEKVIWVVTFLNWLGFKI